MTLALMISVTGCAANGDYCLVAKPIVYEDSDVDIISEKLARSIYTENEKYHALCK